MVGGKSDGERVKSESDYVARYPRICAHIIAESLGYATPRSAAKILQDGERRKGKLL